MFLGAAAGLTHHFCKEQVEWGFSKLMLLKDILDEAKGFLQDDKLEVCSF